MYEEIEIVSYSPSFSPFLPIVTFLFFGVDMRRPHTGYLVGARAFRSSAQVITADQHGMVKIWDVCVWEKRLTYHFMWFTFLLFFSFLLPKVIILVNLFGWEIFRFIFSVSLSSIFWSSLVEIYNVCKHGIALKLLDCERSLLLQNSTRRIYWVPLCMMKVEADLLPLILTYLCLSARKRLFSIELIPEGLAGLCTTT